MKCNQWTLGLAAVGLISLAAVTQAEEAKMNMAVTALSTTTLSGYVDTSAQWNLGTGDAHAPGYGFGGPTKVDGFNLNVVDLNLQKNPEAADGWGAGYQVELWLGPDANALDTQSSGAKSDLAVKNAYVDLKAPLGNGLDIKLGVWDTITGYELADSPNNPNFTRSYGWSIEPTTHTGVLLAYSVCDAVSLNAGVADTLSPVINARSLTSSGTVNESYKTYLASVTFTASTNWGWVGGSTLSGCVINGFNGGAGPGPVGRNQTSLYVGGTLNTPLQKLKVGWSYDYVGVDEQPLTAVPVGGVQTSAYQNVVGLYATYQATEKLGISARGEYFTQSKSISFAGLPSKVIEGTVTIQYDLWKNVLTRLEARWDHQAGALAAGVSAPAFGGVGKPVGGTATGTLFNSYELLANVVYKF